MSSKKDHKHSKKKDSKKSEQAAQVKVIQTRHVFWAHDEIILTDDPFEDDFGEDITRPIA